MLNDIILTLANDIPIYSPDAIDLILEGGMFNGSYLYGILLLIKCLEKQCKLKIKRIYTCSISSLLGYLYVVDKLDLYPKLFISITENLLQLDNPLNLDKHIDAFFDELPDLQNKSNYTELYIAYNKIHKDSNTIIPINQSIFADKRDVCNAILKSTHLPYLLNNSAFIEHNDAIAFDGIFPTIPCDVAEKSIYVSLINLSLESIGLAATHSKLHSMYYRTVQGSLDVRDFLIRKGVYRTEFCECILPMSLYGKFVLTIKEMFRVIIMYIVIAIMTFDLPTHINVKTNLFGRLCGFIKNEYVNQCVLNGVLEN